MFCRQHATNRYCVLRAQSPSRDVRQFRNYRAGNFAIIFWVNSKVVLASQYVHS